MAEASGALRRACTTAATALVAMALARSANADNPLNSSDRTTASSQAACTDGDRDAFNIVPILGGTSDIGIGIGEFSGLARLRRGADPYVWNLETAAFVSAKHSTDGWKIPFQDFYAKLTIPRFAGTEARLELRPSYTVESTLAYYGMGNASKPAPTGVSDTYTWYGRIHPAMDAQLRWPLADHIAALAGARYTQNWTQVTDGSHLANDLKFGPAEVKHLIGPTDPSGLALFSYGVQWDDRDSEVSTHRGAFHEGLLKLSPGGSKEFPYRYGQVSVVSRLFVPVWPGRVTVALRAVADVLFGDPPFYELSRFGDTYALGGANGVRGIPGQRYYGKVKAFGNAEVRTRLVKFRALGKPLVFGAVAFFDGGRLWADTSPHPALDGHGIGLKYGTGGGLRLESGDTFVLRADIAWSPDATPIGAYFAAAEMF